MTQSILPALQQRIADWVSPDQLTTFCQPGDPSAECVNVRAQETMAAANNTMAQAAQSLNDLTQWLIWIGAASVVLGAVGTGLVGLTLHFTRKAAKDTGAALEAAEKTRGDTAEMLKIEQERYADQTEYRVHFESPRCPSNRKIHCVVKSQNQLPITGLSGSYSIFTQDGNNAAVLIGTLAIGRIKTESEITCSIADELFDKIANVSERKILCCHTSGLNPDGSSSFQMKAFYFEFLSISPWKIDTTKAIPPDQLASMEEQIKEFLAAQQKQ